MTLAERIRNIKTLDGQVVIFGLGQAGFIFCYDRHRILIDGYLTDSIDARNLKNNPNSEWIRAFPPPILPEELDFIDFVFCTHAHDDHADPLTLPAICKANSKAKFVVSKAIAGYIEKLGVPEDRIIGLETHSEFRLSGGCFVTAFPAAHEELHRISDECYAEVGFRFCFGKHTVVHSGDCCMYDGLEKEIMNADIAMLPINGRDYYRKSENIIGNFDCREAILLARAARVGMIVPMHHDLYQCNGVNSAVFVDLIGKTAPEMPYHIFVPGDKYILG